MGAAIKAQVLCAPCVLAGITRIACSAGAFIATTHATVLAYYTAAFTFAAAAIQHRAKGSKRKRTAHKYLSEIFHLEELLFNAAKNTTLPLPNHNR